MIRLSETIDGDGDDLFKAACKHGLEGLIAKKIDAASHSVRRGDWVKIKCIQSDGFLIVGCAGRYRPAAPSRIQWR